MAPCFGTEVIADPRLPRAGTFSLDGLLVLNDDVFLAWRFIVFVENTALRADVRSGALFDDPGGRFVFSILGNAYGFFTTCIADFRPEARGVVSLPMAPTESPRLVLLCLPAFSHALVVATADRTTPHFFFPLFICCNAWMARACCADNSSRRFL